MLKVLCGFYVVGCKVGAHQYRLLLLYAYWLITNQTNFKDVYHCLLYRTAAYCIGFCKLCTFTDT